MMTKNTWPLAFLFVTFMLANSLFAQEITGTVTSSTDKLPIPGVYVSVKGTNLSATTDFEGRYSIKVDPSHKVLIFSFIGYKTISIRINNRREINVVLEEDHAELEEVVVTAYGAKNSKGVKGYSVYETDDFYAESYTTIHENGFRSVSKNPLSTFSVDVDGASYSNIRRYINGGSMPPTDAVRIEEMINYFSYDYPQPKGSKPFSVVSELSRCPWNEQNLLLHIGLKGKNIEMGELPASNIVFLLDVSGSMSDGNKLPLLKSSLRLLLDNLRPQDRIAIVVYAGSSGLILPSTSCSSKKEILQAIDNLNAAGSTAGGEGLQLAYKVAQDNFIEEGNNRIILATDGDFNVGPSSNSEMERLIEKERESGVAISVLGFGMGNLKDDKMEIIANSGNGNYAYIDNLLEARKVLVSEFGGTFFTIAKDVKLQLEFNPVHVSKYRLIGYENRLLSEEDFPDDKKDAGEIGAGHSVTALYEIVTPKKRSKSNLKYQESILTNKAMQSNDLVTIQLRYKNPTEDNSNLIDIVVKNEPLELGVTSNAFRFSASVAEFGMLLRDSKHKANSSWESASKLAQESRGEDLEGYRAEMIRLIDSCDLLRNE